MQIYFCSALCRTRWQIHAHSKSGAFSCSWRRRTRPSLAADGWCRSCASSSPHCDLCWTGLGMADQMLAAYPSLHQRQDQQVKPFRSGAVAITRTHTHPWTHGQTIDSISAGASVTVDLDAERSISQRRLLQESTGEPCARSPSRHCTCARAHAVVIRYASRSHKKSKHLLTTTCVCVHASVRG